MQEYKIPGLVIAIIKNGHLASLKSYGVKKSSTQNFIDENTIFEAASLGKPVFAYGVLKLVEKGQLDLDIPLFHYLKDKNLNHDPRFKLLTARMILSHTSGFPNWPSKNEELKIYFQPGSKFSYSGEGFFYLQKVVEKISGQSLEQYMQENVFLPLEMRHSSYLWKKEYKNTSAVGHDTDENPLKISKMYSDNVASSLYTTTFDYSKFIQAIINHTDLQEKTINEMLSPQIEVDNSGPFCINKCSGHLSSSISWGLGFGLQKTKQGLFFWHWGDNPGFKNYMMGSKDGNVIIIFTNSDNGFKIIPEIIDQITDIHQPAFDWLKYN